MEEGRGRKGGKESDGAHSPQIFITHIRSWVLAIVHMCLLSFVGIHFRSWTAVFIVVVVVGGGGCQRGVVSSSMGGCSHLWALDICGWVVVVHGQWMFICGGLWLLMVEGCPWALDFCGWGVVVINGGGSSVGTQLSGVASVGSCGCLGHVHLCVGSRSLWVLIIHGGWWWVMVLLLLLLSLVVIVPHRYCPSSLLSLVVLPCGHSLW